MKENNPGCNCCVEPPPTIPWRAELRLNNAFQAVGTSSWTVEIWKQSGLLGRGWTLRGSDNDPNSDNGIPCDGFTLDRSKLTDPLDPLIVLTPTSRIEVAKTSGPIDGYPAAGINDSGRALFGYCQRCKAGEVAGGTYTITAFDLTGTDGQAIDGLPIPIEPAGYEPTLATLSVYRNAGTLNKNCTQTSGNFWPDQITGTVSGVMSNGGARCAEFNRSLIMDRRPWWGETPAHAPTATTAYVGYEGKLDLQDGWFIIFYFLYTPDATYATTYGVSAAFVDATPAVTGNAVALWRKGVGSSIDCSDLTSIFSPVGSSEFVSFIQIGAPDFNCDFTNATFSLQF